ncbi:6685_t:CDS:2 [Entrophospora sp. SA101]|nr:6685_t:CDS:2 [Entrophospora sp. SA101]CAJ0852828.1 9177_t:CDS:2 [Entrophospora sp. SA101]CAJ0911861.1 7852_t:CDS:2 [Entrophospora sp. SA101]
MNQTTTQTSDVTSPFLSYEHNEENDDNNDVFINVDNNNKIVLENNKFERWSWLWWINSIIRIFIFAITGSTTVKIVRPIVVGVFGIEGLNYVVLSIQGKNRLTVSELEQLKLDDIVACLGASFEVTGDDFIKCAQKIEELSKNDKPPENLIYRARKTVDYLYEHFEELWLSDSQWEELSSINFIPCEHPKAPYDHVIYEQNLLYSFKSLHLPIYKNLIWTQAPIYSYNVIPKHSFLTRFPSLRNIEFHMVLNHLYEIIDTIIKASSVQWKSIKATKKLKKVIFEIYEYLDMMNYREYLHKKLKENAYIFLNGADPFIQENWMCAKNLVLNISEDISLDKRAVSPKLSRFKRLLLLSGASEMKNIPVNIKLIPRSQKERITASLDRFLKEQENGVSKFFINYNEQTNMKWPNDIYFNVRSKKIGANRYMLAASSNYFEVMFLAGTKESNPDEIVHVNVDDVDPNSFLVLLEWLYEKYLIKELKYEVEYEIINGGLVLPQNVIELKGWAKIYSAGQLYNYCNKFILVNCELLYEQRQAELIEVTEEERKEEIEFLEEELGDMVRQIRRAKEPMSMDIFGAWGPLGS